MLQETRAQEKLFRPSDIASRVYGIFRRLARRGYSGVALYCRKEPLSIRRTLGWEEMDAEGRFIQAEFGT